MRLLGSEINFSCELMKFCIFDVIIDNLKETTELLGSVVN